MDDELRIGDFAVEREIGSGAFARVYLARDERLRREVAIKVLSKVRETIDVQRFVAEGRHLARFADRHIVAVYGAGVHEGAPYLAMEYMAGGSLEPLRGVGDAEQVRAVLDDSLSGLATLHAAGVIHRDLKPHNLLRDGAGRVKVGDFGLARIIASAHETAAGVAPGTPSYMAPEQVDPSLGEVGAPADVYAMGVVAYELLTGTVPFGDADMPAHERARHDIPSLAESWQGDDEALIEWVDWTLRRRPRDRPQDAGAALAALRSGRPPQPQGTFAAGARRPEAILIGLVVAAVALLTGTLWLVALALVAFSCIAAMPVVRTRL